jgi:hypothetical protein
MRKAISLLCVLAWSSAVVVVLGSAALSASAGKSPPKKGHCVKKTTRPNIPASKPAGKQSAAKNALVGRPKQPPKPDTAVTGKTEPQTSLTAAGTGGAKLDEARADTAAAGACTSVVVDATGLKLDKCMSPRLVRQDGTVVWGTFAKLTEEQYSMLQERGMAAYVATLEEARSNSRAGSRPLLIKAVATAGAGLKSDVVISDADAQQLLAENEKGKFLDAFNVILVRNENPPPAEKPSESSPAEGELPKPQQ